MAVFVSKKAEITKPLQRTLSTCFVLLIFFISTRKLLLYDCLNRSVLN